ncbi:hypothetical protein [Paucibacter soli]|uniref:hypothetical protein n=1 Tax=Paucibacter soli TaxID=3133433 RepID=UPI0030B3005C
MYQWRQLLTSNGHFVDECERVWYISVTIMSTTRYSNVIPVQLEDNARAAKITRSPQTEMSYLRRAMLFEASTAKVLSIANPSAQVIAAHALEMRAEWSKSSWRQMKASLIFRFEAMGTQAAADAVMLLREGHQSVCAKSSTRTSGRRAKSVGDDAFQAVVKRVMKSASEFSSILSTWLLLGSRIGLRPHEWGQAELIYAEAKDVGDTGETRESALPYLRIRNAKNTNGRSHGQYRHLNLSALDPKLIAVVSDFAKLMTGVTESGEYPRIYEGCRKLLFRINSDLNRKNSKRWVQLYSTRHKFSSEAKKQLSREEVAALMGHATNKTGGEHYGRRISATGTLGPRPIASEVARVRIVRQAQARHNARSSPSATGPDTKPETPGT